jgi:hypothetical protein
MSPAALTLQLVYRLTELGRLSDAVGDGERLRRLRLCKRPPSATEGPS